MSDATTKKRWKLRRAVAVPLWIVGILGALLVAPFLLVRIPGVRDPLLDLVPTRALIGEESRIRVGRVVRFDPFSLRFERIEVESRAAGKWNRWGSIGSLELVWRPLAFVSRRIDVSRAAVDSLAIDLQSVPRREPKAKPSLPERLNLRLGLPRIDIGVLSIERATLSRGDRRLLDAKLRLEDVKHLRGDLTAILSEATVHLESESLVVSLLDGKLRAREAGEVRLDSLRAVFTGGRADLSVELDATDVAETRLRVDAGALQFQPGRFTPLRRLRLPLREGDAVSGELELAAKFPRGKTAHGDLDLALEGQLFGARIDTLDVTADGGLDTTFVRQLLLRVGSLTLEGSGAWQIKAKAAQAELSYAGLDLAGDPLSRFVEGLPATRLRGDLSAGVDSLGPNMRLRARLHSRPGVIRGHLVEGFRASLSLDRDSLRVDSLRVGEDAPAGLFANGALSRETQEFRVRALLDQLDLERWVEPHLPIDLAGRATGELRLFGPIKHPVLRGNLDVVNGQVEEVRFANLAARGVEGTLAPLGLNLDLTLDHPDIYHVKFDSLSAVGRIADIIDASIYAKVDTTELWLDARLSTKQPAWVSIDSLRAVAGSLPPVALLHPSRIDLGKTRVKVDSVAIGSDFGSARGTGWVEPRPGRPGTEPFAFHVEGDSVDLAMAAAYLHLPPDTLRGTADLVLDGEGTIAAPRYSGVIHTGRAEIYGVELADLLVRLRAGELSPGRSSIVIDTLRAALDTNRGRVAFTRRTQMGPQRPKPPALLRGDQLELHWNQGWVRGLAALKDSPVPTLHSATIGGHVSVEHLPVEVALRGRTSAAADASRASFVDPVDPMTLKVVEERGGEEPGAGASSGGVRGTLDGEVELSGTGSAPELDATIRAADLLVLQSRADSANLEVHYHDRLLTIDRFDWTLRGVHTTSEGRIPMRLSIDRKPFELLPESLYVRTTIPEVDLSLATLFTNLVLEPRGKLTGAVEIHGVPPHLFPGGHLSITDGSFRVPAREERITNLNAELRLDTLGVNIESAKGKLNGEGEITATGHYKTDKNFDLHGRVRDVTVFESGNYRIHASGEVWAHPVVDGDTLRPSLTGRLRADRGLITMDLTKQKQQKVLRTPFLINLVVSAPDNLKLIDPRTNLDLSIDSLRVRYRMPNWNYSGEIQIVGGRYRVFSYYFRVTSGTVRFIDSGQGPIPNLDIWAETPVKDGANNVVTVTAHVTGDATAPVIDLDADNGQHGDEVVRLLTYGQSGRFASGSADDPASALAGGEIWGVLEQQLISQLPFFEKFQVQQAGAGDPWQVSFQPISTRQWSVNYTQELVDKAKQSVNLNYRLGPLWYLNAAYQKDFEEQGSLNETFNLDLRFRLEY